MAGCGGDDVAVDMEYPVIATDFAQAFPKQCDTIRVGETFTFKAKFTDNVELGSFSLDFHHNFDHHTHSTEVASCSMEPVKTPKKPFVMIKNYPIPNGLKEYEATIELAVPADVDSGDYHLMILLTDQEGWQTMKGLSVKIQ